MRAGRTCRRVPAGTSPSRSTSRPSRGSAYLAERAPGLAFYSEDRGLVEPRGGRAERCWWSTRSTAPGRPWPASSCCVAVAAAPLRDGEPSMGDVSAACVAEIKSGTFLAERGTGVEIRTTAGTMCRPASVPTADIAACSGPRIPRAPGRAARDRPGRADRRVLGRRRGVRPRVGRLRPDPDRHGPAGRLPRPSRMIDEAPAMRAQFEHVGGGAVLNNYPTTSRRPSCAWKRARSSPTRAGGP